MLFTAREDLGNPWDVVTKNKLHERKLKDWQGMSAEDKALSRMVDILSMTQSRDDVRGKYVGDAKKGTLRRRGYGGALELDDGESGDSIDLQVGAPCRPWLLQQCACAQRLCHMTMSHSAVSVCQLCAPPPTAHHHHPQQPQFVNLQSLLGDGGVVTLHQWQTFSGCTMTQQGFGSCLCAVSHCALLTSHSRSC